MEDLNTPKNLSISKIPYTAFQAKKAYESGEREFTVYAKYPLKPTKEARPTCEYCQKGAESILFHHQGNGALMLRCSKCRARLEGGLYEVGIRSACPKKDKDRLFSSLVRLEIFRRDDCRCWKCGARPVSDELEVDHIIPYAMGGPTELLNGVVLCKTCNGVKSASYDEAFVTNALIYTHRKHIPCNSTGTQATFAVMKAVVKSLQNWKVLGK